MKRMPTSGAGFKQKTSPTKGRPPSQHVLSWQQPVLAVLHQDRFWGLGVGEHELRLEWGSLAAEGKLHRWGMEPGGMPGEVPRPTEKDHRA